MQKIESETQKIDNSWLGIFEIIIISFLIDDKVERY